MKDKADDDEMTGINIEKSGMASTDGIMLFDLGIIVGDKLIICDMHIGLEDDIVSRGVLLPKHAMADMIARFDKMIEVIRSENMRFSEIILNGDIKHDFGKVSDEEWRDAVKFINHIRQSCDNVVIVRGNHDTFAGPVAKKLGIKIADSCVIEYLSEARYHPEGFSMNALVAHGDVLLDAKDLEGIDTIIIGHEHPAIVLADGAKHERFKCYLIGKHKGKRLIIQPSFNPISEGTDVKKRTFLSPFLSRRTIGSFRVVVVGDELYDFGMLRDIMF